METITRLVVLLTSLAAVPLVRDAMWEQIPGVQAGGGMAVVFVPVILCQVVAGVVLQALYPADAETVEQ